MVDTVKGSRQVEQGQHCQVPAVQCQEYVSKDLQNSSFCRVVCSVRRLKVWKKSNMIRLLYALNYSRYYYMLLWTLLCVTNPLAVSMLHFCLLASS